MKRGQLSKESITAEAYKIAAEKGLDGLSYNGLARHIGIQPQSMYRYLANLREVKAEVVALAANRLTDYLIQQLEPYTGTTAVFKYAAAYLEFNLSGIPFTDMINGIGHLRAHPAVIAALNRLSLFTQKTVATASSDTNLVTMNSILLTDFLTGHLAQLAAHRPNENDALLADQNLKRLVALF